MKQKASVESEASVEMPAKLSDTDRSRWHELTPVQRRKAARRANAFDDWKDGKITINDALIQAGLSRSRFYRLAADWRTAPSLEALGALTGTGAKARERIDANVMHILQREVPQVVALNHGASTAQLVRKLVDAAGIAADALPGTITLRSIVENELRRVAATGEAGHAVKFDVTAINLPRENGRPWILFTCLDEGTRLILGAAVSDTAETREGYRATAGDALARMSGQLRSAPWSMRLQRAELTAGSDVPVAKDLYFKLLREGVQANVQLAQKDNRFGKYFRKVVGARIGRIGITPIRTLSGDAAPDNGNMTAWSADEASKAVSDAVTAYNEVTLAALEKTEPHRIPDDLELMLQIIARPSPYEI